MIQYFIIDINLLFSFDIYTLIDYTQLLEHGINLWKGTWDRMRVFTSVICKSFVVLLEPYGCIFTCTYKMEISVKCKGFIKNENYLK